MIYEYKKFSSRVHDALILSRVLLKINFNMYLKSKFIATLMFVAGMQITNDAFAQSSRIRPVIPSCGCRRDRYPDELRPPGSFFLLHY